MCSHNFDKHVLINEVQARPALWNLGDKSFKNKEVNSILWKEIADICNISVPDAKIKWKYLKDQFRRELQKSSSSKWQYFQEMWFIKHHMLITCGEECAENGFDNEHNFISTPGDESNPNGDQENSETGDENEMLCLSSPRADFADTRNSTIASSVRRKRRADDTYKDSMYIEHKRIALLEKTILQSENSDLQFFKSLIPYMDAFSPLDKLEVRMKIQDIVFQQYKRIQTSVVEQEVTVKEELLL